jgi:hypothetical protein
MRTGFTDAELAELPARLDHKPALVDARQPGRRLVRAQVVRGEQDCRLHPPAVAQADERADHVEIDRVRQSTAASSGLWEGDGRLCPFMTSR